MTIYGKSLCMRHSSSYIFYLQLNALEEDFAKYRNGLTAYLLKSGNFHLPYEQNAKYPDWSVVQYMYGRVCI